MNISIKTFSVDMSVKQNGIEFEVRTPGEDHLGDCYLTMSGLIWCRGRTHREHGKKVTWEQFIDWMQQQPD